MLVAPQYRDNIKNSIEKGSQLLEKKTASFYKKLHANWKCLWHFMKDTAVEPKNNLAERNLRGHVIWRKKSYGTQSQCGNDYMERILTVVGTCKQQKRNVLAFIEDAVVAFFTWNGSVSLLPN